MVAAGLEALTGTIIFVDPSLIGWLLFDAGLSSAGQAIGRVGGLALVALSVACWPWRFENASSASIRGLLAYNVPAALFFLYLGIRAELHGVLLWPAAAVHALLSVLLARLLVHRDASKTI
jgi:hypothetical protein